jgi:hypothetical protein
VGGFKKGCQQVYCSSIDLKKTGSRHWLHPSAFLPLSRLITTCAPAQSYFMERSACPKEAEYARQTLGAQKIF